jgi:putative endonuclease
MKSKIIGNLAEEIATQFLIGKGYKIIQRNWKLKNFGEIDIIASKENFLNFVEVKALQEEKEFLPEFHFNKKKFEKIKKLANFYSNKYNYQNWIISLIAIVINQGPKIRYYENI